MNETWRLFIALELPAHVLKAIEALQDDLKGAVPRRAARWSRPEGIHLTLMFLGDVPTAQVETVIDALRVSVAEHASFELTVLGIGCFPDKKRPRVLWAGVGGEVDPLRQLQAHVEQAIMPLGYPGEDHSFSPHLTLARTAQGASHEEAAAIGAAASSRDIGQLAAWLVENVSLMRSHLLPDGPHYDTVARVPLKSQSA